MEREPSSVPALPPPTLSLSKAFSHSYTGIESGLGSVGLGPLGSVHPKYLSWPTEEQICLPTYTAEPQPLLSHLSHIPVELSNSTRVKTA